MPQSANVFGKERKIRFLIGQAEWASIPPRISRHNVNPLANVRY